MHSTRSTKLISLRHSCSKIDAMKKLVAAKADVNTANPKTFACELCDSAAYPGAVLMAGGEKILSVLPCDVSDFHILNIRRGGEVIVTKFCK